MAVSTDKLMEVAIDAARRGIVAGQSPFGCAIAIDGKIVSACHNTVLLTTDITAHAEVNAIREACRRLDNIFLDNAIVATTCEPCPMCMSALHWARVKSVYFGATISDAAAAGFNELTIPAKKLISEGGGSVELIDDTMADACRQLFAEWKKMNPESAY
ncbi:MAG: nucleoside deaminase [Planctomycetales bacterium]|nr:nucleoside deaminase [Planctomycetales bacterium]